MNLISCDKCGVVLDKNKLNFPPIYDDGRGEYMEENCAWTDDGRVPKVGCPVCGGGIIGSPPPW